MPPGQRRQGTGGALLRAAAGWAAQQGASRLILAVTEANAAARGDAVVPVHASDSAVEVWVVPTDEGRVAAKAAFALLAA